MGALRCAQRAAVLDPWDEGHQVLLVSLHRKLGDDDGARLVYEAYAPLIESDLGLQPGTAVRAALHDDVPSGPAAPVDSVSVRAILESGAAAVAVGATDAGLASLRTAVALSDAGSDALLQVEGRIVLAETLVHALRGRDEEGLTALYAADRIAVENRRPEWQAQVRAELGYADFLRARYDRAEVWLTGALELAGDDIAVRAKASTYLASVDSDRGDYGRALLCFEQAIALAQEVGERRREVYAVSMVGRVHLLRGDLDQADASLRSAIELGERERWLAFLPWPQALLGELELARGRVETASSVLSQAFARACQLGDPCWEGVSGRGLALVAEARGDTGTAFDLLADARARASRLTDPYVRLDAYILDALCTFGIRHSNPATAGWVGRCAACPHGPGCAR